MLWGLGSWAQVRIPVEIQAYYGNEALTLQTGQYLAAGESIQFTSLRFYLSQVALLQGEVIVWQETDSYHLIDLSDSNSLKLALDLPPGLVYDSLSVQLGIDSLTHELGVFGGELDPVKGMYWTWQSGYINVKLEGSSPLCPTRKNQFTYHLGGYQAPFATAQRICLSVAPNQAIGIVVDLEPFFQALDLTTQHTLMSPGPKAVDLSRFFAQCFRTDAEKE